MSMNKTTLFFNNKSYCWYEEIGAYSVCPDPFFEPKPILKNGVLILLIILYVLMIGGSIFGNLLVLLIVRTTKSLQNINNLLVANLAVSDIILSTICTPFKFYTAVKQRWDLPVFMCKLCPFVENMCVNLQILNLCLIARDRYKAVMNPLNQHYQTYSTKEIRIRVLIIWILSAILSSPSIFLYKFRWMQDKVHGMKPYCTARNPSFHVHELNKGDFSLDKTILNLGSKYILSTREYNVFFILMHQYIIPMAYLTYVYTKMSLTLSKGASVELIEQLGTSDLSSKEESFSIENKRKSIRMMIVVVICFATCWLPWHLFSILQIFWHNFNQMDFIPNLFFACHWLAMSNGSYNPFIYALFSKNFVNELKERKIFKQRKPSINVAGQMSLSKDHESWDKKAPLAQPEEFPIDL